MIVEPAPDRQAPSAPASRAASMSAGQLRVGRRPVGLVEAVDGQAREQVEAAGRDARRRRSRPRRGSRRRRPAGPSPAARARISSVARRSSGMNRTARRSRGASNRIASTPSRSVAALTDEPAEQRGRRVVGWPSISRREARAGRRVVSGSPSERVARDQAGDRRRGRRPEAARERDRVVHLDPPADACAAARRGPPRGPPRAPRTNRLSRSSGSSPSPSPSTVELDLAAAPAADLELDPVGQLEREAQAVVAGAEVGRRRRHLDVIRRPSSSASQCVTIVALPAQRDGDRADASARPR